MPKAGDRSWLTVKLTPELQERMDKYILAVANKQGRIPYAIKTRLTLKALEEWLEKHDKDLDIF